MPGLIRGMARTAAVVGTATATRNAVNRRQADKNMAAYQHAVDNTQPPQQQVVYVQAPPEAAPPPQQYAPPPAAAPAQSDLAAQLSQLAQLHSQGILSDAEFEAAKAKLLSGG